LLSDYLKLTKEPQVLKLPEELSEVLGYLSNEGEHRKALESYALSTVILLCNPTLSPSSDKLSLQQQLPDIKEIFTVKTPPRFRLGSVRFGLVGLPGDFQTLI